MGGRIFREFRLVLADRANSGRDFIVAAGLSWREERPTAGTGMLWVLERTAAPPTDTGGLVDVADHFLATTLASKVQVSGNSVPGPRHGICGSVITHTRHGINDGIEFQNTGPVNPDGVEVVPPIAIIENHHFPSVARLVPHVASIDLLRRSLWGKGDITVFHGPEKIKSLIFSELLRFH